MHFTSNLAIIFIFSIFKYAIACNNRFEGKEVRAVGDWSPAPIWNAAEPLGLMRFDQSECIYTLTLGGLRPDTAYKWKVCNFVFSFF